MLIHQDARVYAGLFDGAERAVAAHRAGTAGSTCTSRAGRSDANGVPLVNAGDAVQITEPASLTVGRTAGEAEVLVFDLPGDVH